MSWEDDEKSEKNIPVSWENEEEEEETKSKKIPTSWEDEDEEEETKSKNSTKKEEKESVKTQKKDVTPKKTVSKESDEEEEEETKPKVAPKKGGSAKTTTSTKKSGNKSSGTPAPTPAPTQPSLTKQMQQKLVEESDFKHTQDLFSGLNQAINLKQPKDEKDFEGVGEEVASSLLIYKSNQHFHKLVKSLIRKLCSDMKLDDINDLSFSVIALANEKMRLEKDKPKKKTKAPKLNIDKEKGKDAFGPIIHDVEEFNEETDFM